MFLPCNKKWETCSTLLAQQHNVWLTKFTTSDLNILFLIKPIT